MSKAIAWILVSLGALLLGALGYLLAANWQDEPLSEASRRALVYIAPIGNELNGNGHVLLMGLAAPPPERAKADPVEPARLLGLHMLQREQARFKWNERFGSFGDSKAPKPLDDSQYIKATQVLADELRCQPEQNDCIAWFVQHRKAIQASDPARRAVLARLNAIANAPQFGNYFPLYPGDAFPGTALIGRGVALQLAQASLHWNDKAYDKALDQVETLEKLRQRVASADKLTMSSMATSSVSLSIAKWISNASAREGKRLRPQDAERMQRILETPPLSMKSGIRGEMVYSASIIASLGTALKFPAATESPKTETAVASPSADAASHASDAAHNASSQAAPSFARERRFISSLLFLPNQSTNITTENGLLAMDLSDAKPAGLAQAAIDASAKSKAMVDARPQWFGARNIVGSHLLSQSNVAEDALKTIQLAVDVDAYRRLVRLQMAAQQQSVAMDAMPQWLASSPEALRNPYDGQAMQWDAATSSLVFEGREAQTANAQGSKTYRVALR